MKVSGPISCGEFRTGPQQLLFPKIDVGNRTKSSDSLINANTRVFHNDQKTQIPRRRALCGKKVNWFNYMENIPVCCKILSRCRNRLGLEKERVMEVCSRVTLSLGLWASGLETSYRPQFMMMWRYKANNHVTETKNTGPPPHYRLVISFPLQGTRAPMLRQHLLSRAVKCGTACGEITNQLPRGARGETLVKVMTVFVMHGGKDWRSGGVDTGDKAINITLLERTVRGRVREKGGGEERECFMKTFLMSAQTIKPEDRLSPQREAFIDVSTPPCNIPKDSDLRQTGHGDVFKGGKCEVSSPCQSSIGVLAKTHILP
ncbi:hypothetical protein RRG08_042277 [Elysia crispata]|uniref:Uncharacterized protein n=1 Tax=Elysia crispata TaxID=231223 RepID=A0AAE1AHL5_9GAST|nr:hypothetical protein RRG08_042277 [Elysia crispata]